MRWISRIAILLLTVAVVASCAYTPRSLKSTDAMNAMRADYVRDHPDGPFNGQIIRGEVAKGMSVLEVLAAWGMPNMRQTWQDSNVEHWTYYSVDENTRDYSRFELVFANRTLTGWMVERGVAGAGGVPELVRSDLLRRTDTSRRVDERELMSSEKEPVKKKR